jgi:hypothetical protein
LEWRAAYRHVKTQFRANAAAIDIDISICELCGGTVRVIAAIEEPKIVEKILNHLGISSKPPPTSPARYARVSLSDD